MTVLQNPPFLFVLLFAACHGSSTPPSVGHDGDLHGCEEQRGHAQGELSQVHALESIDPLEVRPEIVYSCSCCLPYLCLQLLLLLLDSSSSTAAAWLSCCYCCSCLTHHTSPVYSFRLAQLLQLPDHVWTGLQYLSSSVNKMLFHLLTSFYFFITLRSCPLFGGSGCGSLILAA